MNDPRYVLLPSVSARKEAFDEYCRDRARELRQNRVKQEKQAANPKEEFEALLRDEVKSTRTSWTEWRRQWKKERRFYSWGKDDREREKRFREYLKELGESKLIQISFQTYIEDVSLEKRAAAQKAEADFFALLKESGIATEGAVWKDVRSIYISRSSGYLIHIVWHRSRGRLLMILAMMPSVLHPCARSCTTPSSRHVAS